MSLMDWLGRLFESKDDDSDDEAEESGFEVSQHMRIVIALCVVILSGFILWYILE